MKYVYRLHILDKRTDEIIVVEEINEHQKLGLVHLMAKAIPYRDKNHKILRFEPSDTVALSHIHEHMPSIPCNLIEDEAE